MKIYRDTHMTKLYSDVISERAGMLGIPHAVFHQVATDRGETAPLQHELIQQFRHTRGYVFDWGWIVERLSTIDFEDGTGIQSVVTFGVMPLCLYAERNFDTVRDYWSRIINPYDDDAGRKLPEIARVYFDYFNDFTIVPGEPYELFAIKAECDACIYGTRRWLAAYFLPIVMPAFIRWVGNHEDRPDLLYRLFEQLYAQIYPKPVHRASKRKSLQGTPKSGR